VLSPDGYLNGEPPPAQRPEADFFHARSEGPKGGTRSKILISRAWGSDDPTKAAFAFLHANALLEAGHEVQAFLLGEATPLMRNSLMAAIHPVGWPPLSETFEQSLKLGLRIRV
jgi:predicted peroxiredoxin